MAFIICLKDDHDKACLADVVITLEKGKTILYTILYYTKDYGPQHKHVT